MERCNYKFCRFVKSKSWDGIDPSSWLALRYLFNKSLISNHTKKEKKKTYKLSSWWSWDNWYGMDPFNLFNERALKLKTLFVFYSSKK